MHTFSNALSLIIDTNNVDVAVINAKPGGVATAVNVVSAYDITLIVLLSRQREICLYTIVTTRYVLHL